ncbi:hypothetical protein KCMC57_up47690 [Kitasatospora sp. CMC57]|uniref:Transposase n=1 Tax=Kitasatospora sp. CMC57 TaxID=3231513 RepID=A0AB33K3X7_9ACTN
MVVEREVVPHPLALAAGQGADVGKRIIGRKRSIVTDTIGLRGN